MPDQDAAPDPQSQAKTPEPESLSRGNSADTASASRRESKPTKSLPTNRIAFDKQLDILRAMAAASGPTGRAVTNQDVSEIVQLAHSTVSLANPFFQEAGLIEKADSGYKPGAAVLAFARAWEWDKDTAAHKLAPALSETWFWKTLKPVLDFRELPRGEAVRTLAEAVHAGPSYQSKVQLLLEFLEATGLVAVEGDVVRKVATKPPGSSESEASAEPEPKERISPKGSTGASKASSVATAFMQPTEGVVQFHVTVKVDMAEFAGWQADRIAAFFGGIAQVLAAKGTVEKDATGS